LGIPGAGPEQPFGHGLVSTGASVVEEAGQERTYQVHTPELEGPHTGPPRLPSAQMRLGIPSCGPEQPSGHGSANRVHFASPIVMQARSVHLAGLLGLSRPQVLQPSVHAMQLSGTLNGGCGLVDEGGVRWPSACIGVELVLGAGLVDEGGVRWPSIIIGVELVLGTGLVDVGGVRWPSIIIGVELVLGAGLVDGGGVRWPSIIIGVLVVGTGIVFSSLTLQYASPATRQAIRVQTVKRPLLSLRQSLQPSCHVRQPTWSWRI